MTGSDHSQKEITKRKHKEQEKVQRKERHSEKLLEEEICENRRREERRRNRRHEVIDVEKDRTPADRRVVKIWKEEERKTQGATVDNKGQINIDISMKNSMVKRRQ